MEIAREAENVTLVERLYTALERDDMAAALEVCASDAEGRYPAEGRLAYGGVWHGHDAILAWAEAHDEEEEILDFRVDEVVAAGDKVVALGFFQGCAKSAENTWETSFVHVIAIRQGLVQRFEAFFDTAAALSARRT